MKALKREILLQRDFQHPNIVKLYSSFEKKGKLYMILEFVEKGNLWELLKNVYLNETQVIRIFRQIVSAIKYLHKRKILHRDIKPENILLNSHFDVKLCDFGFCAPYGKDQLR